MTNIFSKIDKIRPVFDWTEKIVMVICKLLLIADILITSYAVAGRLSGSAATAYPALKFLKSIFNDPAWSEEIVLTLMSYMAVLSAAIAIRHGAHIRMTAFDRYLPPIVLRILDLVADIAVLALGMIMLVVGWRYATGLGAFAKYISLPKLSKFWMYFPVPMAGFAMIIFELEAIYGHIKVLCIGEEAAK